MIKSFLFTSIFDGFKESIHFETNNFVYRDYPRSVTELNWLFQTICIHDGANCYFRYCWFFFYWFKFYHFVRVNVWFKYAGHVFSTIVTWLFHNVDYYIASRSTGSIFLSVFFFLLSIIFFFLFHSWSIDAFQIKCLSLTSVRCNCNF